MTDQAGYSVSRKQLDALQAAGYKPEPPSTPGASARLLAEKYLSAHPEPVQDERLRTESLAGRRQKEIRAALNRAGLHGATVAELRAAVLSVPDDEDLTVAVDRLRAARPEWFARPNTRSADAVVRRRV